MTYYIIKVWCTCMVLAPLLFVLFMQETIKGMRSAYAEAGLVVCITIILGLIYFIPSLLLTLIIMQNIVNDKMKPMIIKLITTIGLFLLIGVESIFLYKENLSLIYKGTGTMIFCYLGLILIAPWFYQLHKPDENIA